MPWGNEETNRRKHRRRRRRHHVIHPPREGKRIKKFALVGKANVGKSVIFNRLTGKYASISNYPGTTVEVTKGLCKIGDQKYEIIDTPGITSLLVTAEDERVARKIIFNESLDGIIFVADAKNLGRTLPLVLQLAETSLPIILVLNMMDEATNAGITIEIDKLSLIIGMHIIPTIAVKGEGISELKEILSDFSQPTLRILQPRLIEDTLSRITECLMGNTPYPRVLGTLAMMGEQLSELIKDFPKYLNDQINTDLSTTATNFSDPLALIMTKTYANKAHQIVNEVVQTGTKKRSYKEVIDSATIHPIIGLFIFFGVLSATFAFVGYLGAGILVDFISTELFDKRFNPFITELVEENIPYSNLQEILVGDYGMLTEGITMVVAIVFPIVLIFFLCFAIFEDSGYLPRLALMGNRLLTKVGLNGKAVLPLVLGTGCGTMAVTSTRVLETRRERILTTLLLALGIPCSAQLGVIMGLLTYVTPLGALIVFGVVISQVLLVAYIANLILPGERSDFILEIPPLRIPKLNNILLKTWVRIEWFLIEAVPLFLLGTFLISIANLVEVSNKSLLDHFILMSKPIVGGLLGLPDDAAISLIMGFLRRDYGVVGFFEMAQSGVITNEQLVVGSVVLTLFIPCVATFFMIVKEHGLKVALGMIVFIVPFSIAVGSILHFLLTILEVPV